MTRWCKIWNFYSAKEAEKFSSFKERRHGGKVFSSIEKDEKLFKKEKYSIACKIVPIKASVNPSRIIDELILVSTKPPKQFMDQVFSLNLQLWEVR
ncbi:hypothetical protein YC2023_119274 [Brassica napus]